MFIDRPTRRRSRGLTLIELIVFIIIVSVGLAGLLSALNVSVRSSADPMVRKQMLSIAEALLEEAELQPFTYCDPELDGNWATAGSTAACTTAEGLGPEGAQARLDPTHPLNNVNDYNNLALASPITDINGTASAPTGYTATVAVDAGSAGTPLSLGGITSDGSAANMRVVRILVTVSSSSGDSLALEGFRTRYWPNDQPW